MQRPLVGVAVLVVNKTQHPGCVLVSQRLSSHGKGCFQLPGGHLEFGESIQQCAQRELKEETNLDANHFELVHLTNSLIATENQETKHYITIFMRTSIDDCSTLKCMEPNKNSEWNWIRWQQLKDYKLFQPLQQAIHHQQFDPFQSMNMSFSDL
mgnify:CR=1 FL=1